MSERAAGRGTSRLRQRLFAHMEPVVFLGAALLIAAFVIFGTVFTPTARSAFQVVQTFLVSNFGWFYILTASALLVAIIALLFSRFARVRLGGDDSEPEFGYFTWFSMMMSAGMG